MRKLILLVLIFLPVFVFSQGIGGIRWSKDGNAYYKVEAGEIVQYTLPGNSKTVLVSKTDLIPEGKSAALGVRNFIFSEDQTLILLFNNTVKVWRDDTRGDYWVLNLATKALNQLGKNKPESSLMFAKISPNGKKAAYVHQQNLYVEDLASGTIKALTTDGTRKFINGTFDWAYEEELGCRDGFQWSPDSRRISYWNVDANKIRDFYMINNTDSVYSRIIPVEYPTIGQPPSPAKIGIIDIETGKSIWLAIPGDPQQHYLPRMEWNSASEILVQQLNRKQNESKIYRCDPASGSAQLVYTEKDEAWVDVVSFSPSTAAVDFRHSFVWLNNKKEFLWISEKDGWSHLYRVTKDGSKEILITPGDYDVIDFTAVDEATNQIYFLASPTNATQKYLYKTTLDGKGKLERVSPASMQGSHDYSISPNGKFAAHVFSNTETRPLRELIDLRTNKPLYEKESSPSPLAVSAAKKVEFFRIKTEEGVEMDGWMVKPKNFDASRKYPVVFFVYTEPASQTVRDVFGTGRNRLFKGDMAEEGYIYMSLDGRGTPAPKGRAWRKSIYKKIGQINIRDQALAATEILKWPFVDVGRIAVWGWSGGGSATLNLMFQYPEIYKTGIAVAAVGNLLTYDNIYQERYLGLPQENLQDIINGSPITYAKNLRGNLLYIHGTGDDNVHYANAEMLINELIKYNKQFQFMAYPNRTHSISEGEGTSEHLSTLYTEYLRTYCPPGPSLR
jgi:dipeptidyl-peptidase-4